MFTSGMAENANTGNATLILTIFQIDKACRLIP